MTIRQASESDLSKIRAFVKKNPPLGFHSLYTYWVLCSQFNKLWFVFEEDKEILGFIAGVKNLSSVPTALIWQIGVDERMRGEGVSRQLIDAFLASCRELHIEKGLVTIDPENKSSLGLFQSYFTKHSNFERCGSLDLSDEFSEVNEYEDIYSFNV